VSALEAAGWTEDRFECPEFVLENGETIAPLILSFATIGSKKADGSNAVLMLPSASGTKQWALSHARPGGAIDPDDHFIVTIDAIGGGGSSRPSMGQGPSFPSYSIRDNARAAHFLVTKCFGLPALKAAGGPSMGAMVALELALCFPGFVSGLFLWSPSSRCGAMFPALTHAMRTILSLDPEFRDGCYRSPPARGLAACGLAYFLVLVGQGFLDRVAPKERMISRVVGDAFAGNWDANDLLSRYESLTTHEVRSRPGGPVEDVLARLAAPCLLMPNRSDLLLPFEDAEDMHRQIERSILCEIDGDRGHWAASQPVGSPEHRQVEGATKAFLDAL